MNHFLESVKKAQNSFRPLPFWSWNDALEEDRLRWQVQQMHQAGLGGFFMHARVGLKTPYMQEQWFRCIRACIDEAEKCGMEPWGYDENGYPSGIADGQVCRESENWRATWIELKPVQSKADFADLRVAARYETRDGQWVRCTELAFSGCGMVAHTKNEMRSADPMNPEAVKRFLELTHENYKKELGADFGRHMLGFFTDEPQLKQYQLPWSHRFGETFRAEYGYDVLDVLPALKDDSIPDAAAVRHDYWMLVSKLYCGSFAKQIHQWCRENGCKFTGHVMGEDTLLEQMGSCAGVMPFYPHMDMPGIYNAIKGQFADGKVITQGLSCDVYTWDNGGHVLWFADLNQEASFTINIPMTGEYCLDVGYTLAGDFGIYDILVDGVVVASGIDGFNAGGVIGNMMSFPKTALTKGEHTVTLRCTGKNDGAWGYLIGIDYMKFYTGKIPYENEAANVPASVDAFRTAEDLAALKAAVMAHSLKLDLALFHRLPGNVQDQVLAALLAADRSGADSYEAANKLFLAVTMEISCENPRTQIQKEINRYVSVGDSITEGVGAINTTTDSYVQLFGALLNETLGDVTVINRGISGTRMCTVTENGMYPAAKNTVDAYIVAENPDLLTIAYGINDFHAGTSYEEFITTYRAYLQEIKTKCPNTLVMVFGMAAKGGDQSGSELIQWNAGIKALAEEMGYIYVDTFYSLRYVNWLLSDGLHPSNAGYRVMANAAFRTLASYMDLNGEATQPPKTPGDFGWETDSTSGFEGWTAENAWNLYAQYVAGNTRVWKDIIIDSNNFTITLDASINNKTDLYIKAFGVILELAGNNGSGSQFIAKLNGTTQLLDGHDWIGAEGGKATVTIHRSNGGDLKITVMPEGGTKALELTAAVAEDNRNLELGLYRGDGAKFENITAKTPIIDGTKVNLGETLTVYVGAPYALIQGNGHNAVFTKHNADGTTTVVTVPQPQWILEGETYKIGLPGVSAKEMGDKIDVVIKDAEGNIISTQYSDSVKDYLLRLWDIAVSENNAELKTLVVDLLNYGAAAQTIFNHDKNNLVNSGLTTEQTGCATATAPGFENIRTTTGSLYVGSTLVLEDELQLKFIFKNAEGLTAKVSYTDHLGKVVTGKDVAIEKNGDYYTVTIDTLALADHNTAVTVTISDGTGIVATVTDSMGSYLTRANKTEYEPIAKAMAAAYAYLHRAQG